MWSKGPPMPKELLTNLSPGAPAREKAPGTRPTQAPPNETPTFAPISRRFNRDAEARFNKLTAQDSELAGTLAPSIGTFRAGGLAVTSNPTAFLAGRVTGDSGGGDIVARTDATLASVLQGLAAGPTLSDLSAWAADVGLDSPSAGADGTIGSSGAVASTSAAADVGTDPEQLLLSGLWQPHLPPPANNDDDEE